jgi:purine-binding chemotaxis protein CheW
MEEIINSDDDRYIEFNLGLERFSIPLLMVKEVIPMPEMTNVPNSPNYYVGIMNLRGQIISVIDLRIKMGIKAADSDQETAVIIVEIDGIGIGLIVDSVNKVLKVGNSDIVDVPKISNQINTKFVSGVFKIEDELIVLLDVFNLLDISEIKKIAA